MVRTDAYTPSGTEYECVRCGARVDGVGETCNRPLCDGTTRNISVARE